MYMCGAEGGGDSVEAARPVPTRTWTVSVEAPPVRAPDAVRAALDVYTRKLRARLRRGVKHRMGGDGFKVEPVPQRVAARVTVDAVATVFPAGKTGGRCGLCQRHHDAGLSVQCVRWDGAAVTLAALCRGCVEAFHVRRAVKPAASATRKKSVKAYTLWRERTEKTFADRGERLEYFRKTLEEVDKDKKPKLHRGKRPETELMKRIGRAEWELFERLDELKHEANDTAAWRKKVAEREMDAAAKEEVRVREELEDDFVRGSDGIWRERRTVPPYHPPSSVPLTEAV